MTTNCNCLKLTTGENDLCHLFLETLFEATINDAFRGGPLGTDIPSYWEPLVLKYLNREHGLPSVSQCLFEFVSLIRESSD